MSQIDLKSSPTSSSFGNLYRQVNHLPISYDDFSVYASLFERSYGMLTGGDEQGITDTEGNDFESFVVNRCLRKGLYSGLLDMTTKAENFSGVKLSTRYLTHIQVWAGKNKLQTRFPGVESVEVVENCYDLSQTETISYVAQDPVVIEEDAGLTYARIDASIFENPTYAMLRRTDNNKILVIDTAHARYAEYDTLNDEWIIPLAPSKSAVAAGDDVFGYHIQQIEVSVTKPDTSLLSDGGQIYPVYPNTDQIIEHDILSETETTIVYRFYVRVLVAPSFTNDTVNWERYETYKLYREFELKYFVEEPSYIKVTWDTGDEEVTYQYDPDAEDPETLPRLLANVSNKGLGVVQVYWNDEILDALYSYACRVFGVAAKTPQTITIEMPYKVTPELLLEPFNSQVSAIKKAVIHRVAAELPVRSCGCNQEIGFIADQQQSYEKAYQNPYTGVELVEQKYGQRHGQQVYEEIMEDIVVYRPRFAIGARL